MKLTIDTTAQTVTCEEGASVTKRDLYSRDGWELITREWVRVGWNQKYVYTFTWFGRPIIQLPDDLVRIQEVIYRVKPDVIVETGVAHGGSLIFYSTLFQALGKGRVIGVDIEIRDHNRDAIERHELAHRISLVDGSSTDPDVVKRVESLIRPGESVLVLLDSNHTKAHVATELDLYHRLVTPGSYIVATDGIMKDLSDVPRGKPDWAWNHPSAAAEEFARAHPEFAIEQPEWPFNESELRANVTHWPRAYLRRL